MEIRICSNTIGKEDLRQLLNERFDDSARDGVRILRDVVPMRAPDPTVAVALVSASSAALGALLTGLLQIAKERFAGKIVLQGSDGSRVEVPANTDPGKLDELVTTVRTMSRPNVVIGS